MIEVFRRAYQQDPDNHHLCTSLKAILPGFAEAHVLLLQKIDKALKEPFQRPSIT